MKYFVTVVQEKTVTAAAKQLNMTQPPLTSQIHLLEEELDCKLFRRAGRRLYLTEAGQHFYTRATQILGMCESARQEISDFSSGSAGTLRVGVISSVQGTIFLEAIKAFHNHSPNVKLSISSANTYELLEMMQNRVIDLAIVRTPFPEDGLDVLHLRREAIMAVGSPEYFRGTGSGPLKLNQLSSTPLIIYRRWQRVIEAGFEAAGCVPFIFCANDDASMTLQLALQGMGVALLHPSALSHLERPMVSRQVDEPSLVSQIALVRDSRQQLPQTARYFWNMVEMKFSDVKL